MQGTKNKGQILVMVLLIMSAIMAGGFILLRNVIAEREMANLFYERERAFYIAEAGLEEGKLLLASNTNWFTDNPKSQDDDPEWVIHFAEGLSKKYGGGNYKIVRESGKNMLYSAGIYKRARSVVRIRFDIDPLRTSDYKLL